MNGWIKRWVGLLAGFGISAAMAQALPVPSADTPVAPAVSTTTTAPALTATDLGAFFDGLMPFALRRSDIAGGVVVVVRDGKVLFASGYGYADLAKRTPVSPQTTLFRPGSTSKLFTWTAVMQLVEQGKLGLDRDINDYLDFRIPPYDGKPITLRNLMTHTPGFEDSARDLMPAAATDVNLERYLKSHIPARIFPPGKIVAYSNYGAGLAGYIVQRVSGERFEDYIARHIFQPLGMTHSTFAQPPPPALAALLSKGYHTASDGKPQPFELIDPAPAGAMTTSAMDMARFMIAQLQDGRYADARILQTATARMMHSQQYTPAPGMPGFDLGFYQEDRNGLRIIGHGGDTVLFHSDLHLLLDQDVGIFMSFNSAGSSAAGGTRMLRAAIFHAFLDRYFPWSAPIQPASSSAKTDAARVTGWYQPSRRNDSALRLLYLTAQTQVASAPDGTLSVSMLTDDAGKPLHWREVGPLHYRQVNGPDRLDFVTHEDGSIRYWTTDYIPPIEVFQPVPGRRSLGSVALFAGLATLIVLASLVVWLGGCWIRRHHRSTLVLPRGLRRTRLLSRLGALALVVVVVGWILLTVNVAIDPTLLLQGTATPWMVLLYVLGVAALPGVVAFLVHARHSWRAAPRRWLLCTGETVLGLAAIYLGWFIVAFGLVSFNTHF
ncbi:MAG TPA: serine hydrolase domain-containing protein [Rhodanobacter sp.]|nr:serine hydrolase domain-containing protein [Rhodanobacter sp.]